MKLINKKVKKEVIVNSIRDFTSFGSSIFHIIALVFVLIIDSTLFFRYLVTIGITTIVILILKSSVFAKRPKKGKTYKTYLGKIDKNSRFSGHTASSFAFALAIGLNTNKTILIFLLCFALLVGLSRIALGRHYIKNIINGGLIGIAIGLITNLWLF